MFTLFKLFGLVFLAIWCANAVPTPLLALHPCRGGVVVWTIAV